LAWAGTLLVSGCMTGPLQENPVLVRGTNACDNPVFVPLGPNPRVYGVLFERVLEVVTDFNFEIAYSNRYDGRIESQPTTSPGLGQPWKPGSPDFRQRVLATFQSIRHRAIVLIQPAPDGGYFIEVQILKELEDLARPIRAAASAVAFRGDATLERQNDVIDASVYESNWIPIGRDTKMEQLLLERIARIDTSVERKPWFSAKTP
jgi:hypothetical protein